MRLGRAEAAWRELATRVRLRAPAGEEVAQALDWHAQPMGARVDLEDKQAVFERLGRL